MDDLGMLGEAIRTVPIPAAPPRMSLDGAAVGLGFLDAALRLNHVRRLTERLTISKHRIAERITQVDISLNMMTDVQLEAAAAFRSIASHSGARPAAADSQPEPMLWVPVARLPQADVGPIEVRDQTGRRLPRLTQYEISRLVASGMYQLLHGILASHPDAQEVDAGLCKVLHRINEPRWLIQSAVLTVLTEGTMPQGNSAGAPANRARPATGDQHRDLALAVVTKYKSFLADYLQLFEMAASSHIIVVALDSRSDEHLLTFETPLYVNKRDRLAVRGWHLVRASRDGYYVSYITDIPATLRSYHLVAQAAPGVNVRQLFLTTNAAVSDAKTLSGNLSTVADRLDHRPGDVGQTGRDRAVEAELEGLLHRLSELVRRRRWEARTADVADPLALLPACGELIGAAERFEAGRPPPEEAGASLLRQRGISADALRRAAAEVTDLGLGHDLVVETHPITNSAHGYWRRPPLASAGSGQTRIRAGMVLLNTTDVQASSARMVVVYALAVSAIAYVAAAFLTRTPWPYGAPRAEFYSPNASEIIVILLLVPGYLYSRLALPEHETVAGHLRWLPRLVAYISIASMVTLSAALAANTALGLTWLAFIVGTALPLVSTLLLAAFQRGRRRTAHTYARMDAPRWATGTRARGARAVTPDVRYTPTGSTHDE